MCFYRDLFSVQSGRQTVLTRYSIHEFPEIIYDDNGVFLYALLMFVLSPFAALFSKTRLAWHV